MRRDAAGLPHRIDDRHLQHRARGRIAGQASIEHRIHAFQAAQLLSYQSRAVDIADRRHDTVRRVRHEMSRSDRPHLAVSRHSVGMDLHEHGFAQFLSGRTRVIAAA